MLLQILDTWPLRLHVESNKTLRFLGGSLLGVMRESPMFMPICWFWLVLLWVVITISSVLSSFSFKRLLVIHIFMSLIQASGQDIAVSFDTDTPTYHCLSSLVFTREQFHRHWSKYQSKKTGLKKIYDDVIKWKYFPRYWPCVWGIHRSPMTSPHKG